MSRSAIARELDEFTQDASGVAATVTDVATGRRETFEADYIVGCDGAESLVREIAGIPMAGSPVLSTSVNIFFVSRELPTIHDKGDAWANWLVGPDGQWGLIVAVDGREMWRLGVSQVEAGETLGAADAAALIRRAAGRDFAFDIKAILPWTRRQLVAERYRGGRAFLAGDSAHLMSPTGGLGMNTGIGDAVDLSWKLAAVVQGWGGNALLDSYDARAPPDRRAQCRSGDQEFPQAARATRRARDRRRHAGRRGAPRAHPRYDHDRRL